jgi:LCP family protein required for cell wall assembly
MRRPPSIERFQGAMTDRPRPRHPALAATLSFLFPGLGQAYAGQRRLAALLAVPVLLLLVGIGVAYLAFDRVRNEVLSSSFLVAVLLIDAALLVWRLFAIAEIGFAAPTRFAAPEVEHHPGIQRWLERSWLRIGFVSFLLAVTLAMHAWLGLVVVELNSTLDRVFAGGNPAAPQGGGGTVEKPLNRPEYRWNGTERVNFLLLGIDSGVGRDEALTDTILVVSVDPVARTAVMVSVPRDTGYLPLPDTSVYADGRYPRKINQLSTDANADAKAWCPDLAAGADCGIRTLERSVGLYLGIPIQYYATVDLAGFTELIDAVGGVELCLPGTMVDDQYSGPTWSPKVGITLEAGCRHYDGVHALAYARIRKGYIELPDGTRDPQNDFKRADRQQEVLLALRRELAATNLVFELPRILDVIGRTVATDFPRDKVGDLATLLPLVAGPDIKRVVLGLPKYVGPPVDPSANYLLIPKRNAIRTEMRTLFGDDLQGWYVGSRADGPPSESASPSATPTRSPGDG